MRNGRKKDRQSKADGKKNGEGGVGENWKNTN